MSVFAASGENAIFQEIDTIRVLKSYQIWDKFFVLAKRNEGRRSSATLTGVTHGQNEKGAQRCEILEEE